MSLATFVERQVDVFPENEAFESSKPKAPEHPEQVGQNRNEISTNMPGVSQKLDEGDIKGAVLQSESLIPKKELLLSAEISTRN